MRRLRFLRTHTSSTHLENAMSSAPFAALAIALCAALPAAASAFHVQLAKATGEAPQWNFHKYLIDRSGKQVVSFGSRVKPDDEALLASIDAFLGE